MKSSARHALGVITVMVFAFSLALPVFAQRRPYRMTDRQVEQVVPTGFYFKGQSAPTQMRNATAMRFGEDRYVIAGLVDTSGYAAEVRAKYEGFLIADLPIAINGRALAIGVYGFGFSNDGKLNIMDIAGNDIFSVPTTKDNELKRPRPLMMMESGNGVRLYSGKSYAVIEAK